MHELVIGLIYVMVFSVLAVIIMVKTKFNNWLRIGLLIATLLAFYMLPTGHLIGLMPKLGSNGVMAETGPAGSVFVATYTFPLALLAFIITLGLTFVVGRAICSYGCPVGVVQELLYEVPTGKNGKNKLILPAKISYFIRLGALVLIVVLFLAVGLGLIQMTALSPFVIPVAFIIGACIMASIFVYRPFCRVFCPYGALAALVAKFSKIIPEKGDFCTECGLCDMKCPTGELNESYGECYLCGRCVRTCNVDAVKFC
ncbi:MAG: 4Fe-4S binding protein [Promethearchaeota archaeon]